MRRARSGDLPAVRIEADNEWAWCGERRLELPPRVFAVLRHLVDHAARLVTKADLLAAVWRDAVVSDAALTSCIRDLRRALGDSSSARRYIQTVHRRGFRFVGPVASPPTPQFAPPPGSAERPSIISPAASILVGRTAELARLTRSFEKALNRQRQLVFVTGEPGIGKTALVEAFLDGIAGGAASRVGRGQCVEQYGAGEAYLPVLEALGRLGRESRGPELVQILQQCAPTWLARLPALLTDRELEAVQRRAHGATSDRMLRELVEALDAVSSAAPLVLVLEDLHWSDAATIDLLAMLARRREPARLLVLGTYRPADVAGSRHALWSVKQELELHGHCEEMPLDFLSVAAVGEYLARRFPRHQFPPELGVILHRHTDGNPLFVVNTVDDLIARGQLRDADGRWALAVPVHDIAMGAPDTLWRIVETQVARLTPDEQAVLAVASVAGAEFSAAVAAADGIDRHEGERRYEALARRGQFLRAAGMAAWPDGTVAARYAFIHALYRNVLYERISIGYRVGLHLRTGERLERGYGERAGEIAGELAMHFAEGRDFERAVRYRRRAGENALRQHGYREAAHHATRALDLLGAWPDSPERIEQELTLQSMLGAALGATQGYADPAVARTYARARELSEQVDDTDRLFPVILDLGRFHNLRGEVQIARGLGTRLLALAETTGDAAARLAAHNALGIMSFYEGDFETALAQLDRAMEWYDPNAHSPGRSALFRVGHDVGVSCAVYAAWALQVLGYPARAAARMGEALAAARALEHPFSVAYACHFAAGFHLIRHERDLVGPLEDEALACATEHGLRLFRLMGTIHRGWLRSTEARGGDGLTMMREGLNASRALGMELRRPAFLALVADVCERMKRPEEGLSAVDEALTAGQGTGQHYWDAELHRLRGVLTLQSEAIPRRTSRTSQAHPGTFTRTAPRPAAQRPPAERNAEACFLQALEIARRQRARLFELRAATSLGRLLAARGRAKEAHALLSTVYREFTEGFDTPDLTEAKALLDALGA